MAPELATTTATTTTTNGTPQTSARGRVREDVRKLILSGELKPGTRLTQQHLAKRFGVAQSVVRESLLELQASGLVRSVDNLGIFVSDLDTHSLIHAYHVREVLEGLAARVCCERASRADIRELYDMAERIDALGQSGQLAERGTLDRAFHHKMILISANPILTNLTDSYQMLNMVVQLTRDHEQVFREHRAIVQAIENGDCDEAERAARTHVAGLRTFIQKLIAEGKFEPRWVLE
jgi:DNA-binding GntR family transcriptional regulator